MEGPHRGRSRPHGRLNPHRVWSAFPRRRHRRNYLRGAWYYLDPSSGVVHTGWLKDGGHWYYLTRSEAMVMDVRWIDGKRYVFDARGRLLT